MSPNYRTCMTGSGFGGGFSGFGSAASSNPLSFGASTGSTAPSAFSFGTQGTLSKMLGSLLSHS